MRTIDGLIDESTWKILTYLHKNDGARFTDIRDDLELSDSVTKNRLGFLKILRLVSVTPVVTEDKNFFEYKLTDKGVEFMEKLHLDEFMKRLEKLLPEFKLSHKHH